jgi:hypothetical protein
MTLDCFDAGRKAVGPVGRGWISCVAQDASAKEFALARAANGVGDDDGGQPGRR